MKSGLVKGEELDGAPVSGNKLTIENAEHFTTSLNAVSLAENLVSHLLGGGSAQAREIRTGSSSERIDSARSMGSDSTWCIHRGKSSYGIEVAKLLPCGSPLMRSRSLFEVARAIKEGGERGRLPVGDWDIDGVVAKESHLVSVTTALGEIVVAVERVEENELHAESTLGSIGSTSVSLPMTISVNDRGAPQEWIALLSIARGPLSLIVNGPLMVRVLEDFYMLKGDVVLGGIFMQRVEAPKGEETVSENSENGVDGDSTVSLSIYLGEVQLTLANLARLRKGHTLRLMEENLPSDGCFTCSLTLGSTQFASGKLRFSGDKVVLTIAEVV